jgi:tryptophanyl-tRNA synthetase
VTRGTTIEEAERSLEGARGYGDLKGAVAEAVVDYLGPTRERYAELRADEAGLEDTLEAGADKARAIASEVAADVRERMGVGPPRRS